MSERRRRVGRPVRRVSGSALVTGASRGIGRGIARALAGAGHDVVVNYASNAEAAGKVVAELEAAGARARRGPGRHRRDGRPAAARRRRRTSAFGRVDLLVNNAGVAPIVRADILDAGEESFDRVIGINLQGRTS